MLVASEPIHLLAWKQLLEALKLPYDPSIIQLQVGKTAPEILKTILNIYKPGWNPNDYNVNELAKLKSDFYLPLALGGLQAYPGATEGLEWLRSKKIATAVVSNAKRRELKETLERLNLFNYFDLVISRDDVQLPKPDPTPYLFAAASLGLEVQDCMAVEDSPPGIEAALFAKIPSAAITSNFTHQELTYPVPGRPDLQPVWIGSSLVQFFEWLKILTE